jgi:hypothetical protein
LNNIGSTDPTPADFEARPSPARLTTRGGAGGVRLVPDKPPGRCTRKALPFAGEIHRLYAMGYTLEAIRQALSAAGVTVSRSTVHREMTRATRQPAAHSSMDAARSELDRASQTAVVEPTALPKGGGAPASPGPSPSPEKPSQSSFANGPRGEDVAKAFMSIQITNPFMREKEQR